MTTGVYRDGDVLVVPPNATLPDICVCCGRPAHARRTKLGFHWRPREYYLLWAYDWVGILVLLTVARERIVLSVPLCPAHRLSCRLARWVGYGLLIGALPAVAVWSAFTFEDVQEGLPLVQFLLSLLLASGVIVLILFRSPLRAAFIRESHGYFIGAGRVFLDALPGETNRNAKP